jgi:putative PEP-CTERM system histidine kinase
MDAPATGLVGLISHAMAAAAYLLLAVLARLNWKHTRLGLCLILASFLTALWAGGQIMAALGAGWAMAASAPLETLRSGGWIVFLLLLLNRAPLENRPRWLLRWVAPALLLFIGLLFLAELADSTFEYRYGALATPLASIVSRLLIAVGGLLLVENLYRNTAAESRWSVKYLCLGLGAFFVYDLYLYANGLLFQKLDPWVMQARGVTNAVIVPLLAVSAARNPDWKVDIFVSRRLAFYSATLMASGAYLVVMAMVGYYLRAFGGSWGSILQVAFLFGGGLLLVVVLFSGRYRTQMRVFISKHFFNYRYDYREEWLRFISTIANTETSESLGERAIKAVADLMESPGGLLFLDGGTGDFRMTASWNLPPIDAVERAGSPFLAFMDERRWIVDVPEALEFPDRYEGLGLPGWLDAIRALWLVIPLAHHERLTGFIVLQEARARRDLNWEDHDILKTLGRQVASYIAEWESARALAEARQFDAFNRRFAFVLHDIKNLVSQLSLMTANAERHAGNPEFQRDMLLTVRESVTKMKAMLERLHGTAAAQGEERVEVMGVLRDLAARKKQAGGPVVLEGPVGPFFVKGERERLTTVFEHVVQNALDATQGDEPVVITVSDGPASVTVAVADKGAGMDAEFVRTQLFKPFRTTKTGGYGIGAYESREIVTEAGGSLDVESTPGVGTTVLIVLKKEQPVAEEQPAAELEDK